MYKKRYKKLIIALLSLSLLGNSCIYAEEIQSEIQSDVQSELPPETEPQTEPPAPETEPPAPETEPPAPETEPPAPQTEAPAPQTEAPASQTEAPVVVEPTTPAATETNAPQTEAPQSETSKPAPSTEAVPQQTEETKKSKKNKKETEEEETEIEEELEEDWLIQDPTLHTAGYGEAISIPGFSVDPSKYPDADITENVRVIYQYLTGTLGLNHAGACGVLGNMQLESNFNPLALGDSGSSYGICQWHNNRFIALMNHCKENGLDYNTIEGQLSYLSHELNNGYSGVYSYILGVENNAEGAYDAAHYFCVYFESPDNTMARAVQRGNLAKNEYYPLDLATMNFATSDNPIFGIRESMNGTDFTYDIRNIRKDLDNEDEFGQVELFNNIREEMSSQSEEDIFAIDAINKIRNSN